MWGLEWSQKHRKGSKRVGIQRTNWDHYYWDRLGYPIEQKRPEKTCCHSISSENSPAETGLKNRKDYKNNIKNK